MSRKLSVFLFAMLLTLALLPVFAQQERNNREEPSPNEPELPQPQELARDFDALSHDLVLMHDLFQGGNNQPVTFNSEAAYQRGFSPASIKLAEELTAHTNELIFAASTAPDMETVDVTKLDADVQQYPLLESYLEEATERRKNADRDEEPLGAKPSVVEEAPAKIQGIPGISEYQCGSFARPRPSRGAPWATHRRSNPAATLRSWGYHETPSWAGGGWTRSQTYMPLLCGWNTYRDHAYISNSNTIREQNYAGWTPRGEPNPEVWRSGPWPYATWPVYVRWWHSRY